MRPGYFETVEMPLERGRLISSADRADSENVLLVNEAFVKRFWPGEGPLGRTVSLFSATGTPSRVVGMVGDVRQHGRARAARAEMYFPHAQVPWDQMAMWMMVRFSDDDPLWMMVRFSDDDPLRSGLSKILLPVAGGLALGVGGGAVTADALTSVLYAIEPTAAATFVGVTLVLGTAALLAALVPAWRASRVDPVAVLNRE